MKKFAATTVPAVPPKVESPKYALMSKLCSVLTSVQVCLKSDCGVAEFCFISKYIKLRVPGTILKYTNETYKNVDITRTLEPNVNNAIW